MPDPIARLNASLEGHYALERALGQGGMATVYLARDLKHERRVAVKVLKPELAAAMGAERFLAEIRTTASLQHPHILPLFDSGEADGFLFYVMPYVEGESLRQRLDRGGQLPVDEAVRVATGIANALDYAHRNGVIRHRLSGAGEAPGGPFRYRPRLRGRPGGSVLPARPGRWCRSGSRRPDLEAGGGGAGPRDRRPGRRVGLDPHRRRRWRARQAEPDGGPGREPPHAG